MYVFTVDAIQEDENDGVKSSPIQSLLCFHIHKLFPNHSLTGFSTATSLVNLRHNEISEELSKLMPFYQITFPGNKFCAITFRRPSSIGKKGRKTGLDFNCFSSQKRDRHLGTLANSMVTCSERLSGGKDGDEKTGASWGLFSNFLLVPFFNRRSRDEMRLVGFSRPLKLFYLLNLALCFA